MGEVRVAKHPVVNFVVFGEKASSSCERANKQIFYRLIVDFYLLKHILEFGKLENCRVNP